MATGTEIAIVGMAGRFPGAPDIATLWQNLLAGQQGVVRTPGEESGSLSPTDEHWVDVSRLLPDGDQFDAGFFGISPREAADIDPQHRIFLETCYHALEDAGWTAADASRSVGVFGGVNFTLYGTDALSANADSIVRVLPYMLGADKDYLTTRVSHLLGLHGPSVAVHCACSTSLVAVHFAARALLAGECDAALAGGASAYTPRNSRDLFVPGAMLSPDGNCRAFDAAADGTVFAEGAGVVLIMRLQDALDQKRNIHAVILGSAVNNDGDPTVGFSAPTIDGQVRVVRQAQRTAGARPGEIGFIEAHGTGTVLGDAIELAALHRVFGDDSPAVGACALGSIKTNIGHLAAAAGVAGLIKAALAVKHGVVPPTLHFSNPNPDFDPENSPFVVNTEVKSWSLPGPRRAGISSFGIGGTNAHLILEEPPIRPAGRSGRRWHTIRTSGKTAEAADVARLQLRDHLQAQTEPETALAGVAFSQAAGRADFDYRQVVVAEALSEAVDALADESPARLSGRANPPGRQRVVFMFPGQGSQFPGMARDLYDEEPRFRAHFETCLDIAKAHLPESLRRLLLHCDPADEAAQAELRNTAIAQPALFVIEYCLAKTLQDLGVEPAAVIGHSLGEFVAAVIAGAMPLAEAMRLVCRRGALMQAAPVGAMLSVAADEAWLRGILPPGLDIAAYNAPDQIVVSGPDAEISAFERRLVGEDATFRRLHTSHAFHSRLMVSCLDAFREEVDATLFREPALPYASNLTGAFVRQADLTSNYWVDHIRQPVRFAQGLDTLLQMGADVLLEVGPGRSLSSLCRMSGVDGNLVKIVACMPDQQGGSSTALSFNKALAACWIAGLPVKWSDLYLDDGLIQAPLPLYPYQRKRYWTNLSASSAPQAKADVGDWLYAPGWMRSVPVPTERGADRVGESALIFAGDAAEGRLLLAEWRLRGGDGVIVTRGGGFRRRAADHFEVHPRRADDYTALAEALAEREILPARVVHLWGLSEPATAGEDVYLSPDTTLGLDRMLAALLGRPGRPALDVVAVVRGVAAPLDADMLEPRNAGVLALAMVAAQEHPALRFRVLDTDRVEVDRRFAGVLLDEQAYAEGELLTAYRGPSRFVRRFERLPAALTAPRESRLQSGGVYVLLGGLGHIGLGLAEYLAQRYGARLVLTGRQGAPPRAEWPRLIADPACPADMRRRLERLLAIESHAGGLLVLASDVTAESDLQAVRKRAHATFGQIDGLMLLAGAMGSSETAAPACDEAALAAAMAAKAGGTAAAVRVFDEEPLAFGLIFSSISSLLGGIGHFAYAASNQYADAVIQAQAEPGPTPWMSVNWDLWQGTAIDGPAATDRLNNRAISGAEGAMALERLLQLPPIPQVVVSTHDLQARLRTWASASLSAEDETPTAAAYERPEISTPFAPPETELEIHIAGIWQKLLGVGQVGRNDDFFELGGHSLLGVKLIGGLRNDFAVDVSLQEAFRSPTVADMASLVDERLTCFVEALAAEDARAILEELDT